MNSSPILLLFSNIDNIVASNSPTSCSNSVNSFTIVLNLGRLFFNLSIASSIFLASFCPTFSLIFSKLLNLPSDPFFRCTNFAAIFWICEITFHDCDWMWFQCLIEFSSVLRINVGKELISSILPLQKIYGCNT